MIMRRFEISDLEEVNNWARRRDAKELDKQDIPNFGLIVPGVAAGFLIKTDTKTAIIDLLVTNPGALREERNNAIMDLWDGFRDHAKDLGYKKIMTFTKEPSIAERCISMGADYFGTPGLFMKGI